MRLSGADTRPSLRKGCPMTPVEWALAIAGAVAYLGICLINDDC